MMKHVCYFGFLFLWIIIKIPHAGVRCNASMDLGGDVSLENGSGELQCPTIPCAEVPGNASMDRDNDISWENADGELQSPQIPHAEDTASIDWDSCIICGTGDDELQCPLDRLSGGADITYGNFLENVAGFRMIKKLPTDMAISEGVTVDILLQNRAKWHKTCHLKLSASKLQRAKQRCNSNDRHSELTERKSRRLSGGVSNTKQSVDTCVFCVQSEGKLHNCTTLEIDKTLRDMATCLQDFELLSCIEGGDLVAIEAKYHLKCLTKYRNRYRGVKRNQETSSTCEDGVDSRVFAELVSYVENEVEDGTYIFRLTDLHKLYEQRLAILGCPKLVNKSRLKRQFIEHFSPDCQEQTDGKNILLVFNEGMQQILKDAMASRDFDQEAVSMARLSKVIRRDISDGKYFKFSGDFPQGCEEQSVPTSLKSLVSMLLYGPNIKAQTVKNSRACLTICQLVPFNFKEKLSGTKHLRHDKIREPPLPLYIGLDVHSHTRGKKLVNELCELGISVNYKRVLEIEDWFTSALCQRYQREDLVCPSQIREGVFTVGALDNIDHNPTSTTAKGSFHGTSISVLQFPTEINPGILREAITVPVEENQHLSSLPESYSIVPAVACNTSTVAVSQSVIKNTESTIAEELLKEEDWHEKSIPLLTKDSLEKNDFVAWGAYHASVHTEDAIHAGTSTLLPLFNEKAATVAMVKHGMSVIQSITAKCNPGQIPAIAVDQPLFALAKYVQWNWPDSHGEERYVVMLGGLHIEMALWRMIGDLLEESGWPEALTEANVASPGTADSFLCAAHLTKTRHAHQVTALALAKMQRDAWQTTHGQTNEAFSDWRNSMLKNPMFKFWDLILRLETLVLIFVRAHRQRNFRLYVDVLELLVPFFFVLDHTNYARWLPVHIKDMKSLPEAIEEDFRRCWVFQKTTNKFSAIPLDQAHEQNNRRIKESGGAVGLTENPGALNRWMIAGPEQMRLLSEFQTNSDDDRAHSHRSHDQGLSTQETFRKQVNCLCKTVISMGNPFLEDTDDLMRLDTHDCADQAVSAALSTLEQTGKLQCEEYVKSVLVERTRPIQSPIKKNKTPLFKRPPVQAKTKTKQNTEDLKSDYCLFSQLFIASQVREGDLDEFFSHENHPWPPALSQHGNLRLPTCKSELLGCLDVSTNQRTPHYDAKIFDGAVIVHSLHKGEATTFSEYSNQVFLPWLKRQLENCNRIDIVWDTYKLDSLKEATREKRGKGKLKKVTPLTRMPVNFSSFLRNSRNKEGLFTLLTAEVASSEFPDGKEIYITAGNSVVVKGTNRVMQNSNHEEADTRMCLHVQDAVQKGVVNIVVSTVDTDVVLILLGIFCHLRRQNPIFQLWVEFGKGKTLRYYHINSLFDQVGEEVARSMPFFHAFTGCDTTSQFGGKGKKSAWKAWKALPQATTAFTAPSQHPFSTFDAHSDEFKLLERFVCVLYDSTTQLVEVNDLRQELFSQGKNVRMMHALPPTKASLEQHINRSIYQASIWLTSLDSIQAVPSPDNFGWAKLEDIWKPVWTTLSEAASSCRELIKCGCKALPLCSKKCICKNTQLKLQQVRDLNQQLVYQVDHQKVQLQAQTDQISRLQDQLLAATTASRLQPHNTQHDRRQLEAQIANLTTRLTQAEEEAKDLEEEKDDWKEKYWDGLRRLEEAHRLVTTHLHTAAAYRDQCHAAEEAGDHTDNLLQEARAQLDIAAATQQDMTKEYEKCQAAWTTQREALELDIKERTASMEQLSAENTAMNVDNIKKAKDIDQLKSELHDALAILNVEKAMTVAQTDLCMLGMADYGLQVEPETADMAAETFIDTCQSSTQTIDPAPCSIGIQTDHREVTLVDAQTGEATLTCSQATQTGEATFSYSQTTQTGEATTPCSQMTQTEQCVEERGSQTDTITEVLPIAGVHNKVSDMSAAAVNTRHAFADKVGATQGVTTAACINKIDDATATDPEHQSEDQPQSRTGILLKWQDFAANKHTDSATNMIQNRNSKDGENKAVTYERAGNSKEVERIDNILKGNLQGQSEKDTDKENLKRIHGLSIGIKTPSLDLFSIKQGNESVIVDPEDFEVKLTQDGGRCSITNMPDDSGESSEEVLLIDETDDSSDIDPDSACIAGNTTDHRSKPDKRKLTHRKVLEEFTNFDEAREKFLHPLRTLAEECSQPKIPRVASDSSAISEDTCKQKDDHSLSRDKDAAKTKDQHMKPSVSLWNQKFRQTEVNLDGAGNEAGTNLPEKSKMRVLTSKKHGSSDNIAATSRKIFEKEEPGAAVVVDTETLPLTRPVLISNTEREMKADAVNEKTNPEQYSNRQRFSSVFAGDGQRGDNKIVTEASKLDNTDTRTLRQASELSRPGLAKTAMQSHLGGRGRPGEVVNKTSGQTLLQKYQNIVASLKSQSTEPKGAEAEAANRSASSRSGQQRRPRLQTAPETTDAAVFSRGNAVSPGGILRGNQGNSKRPKNVSWNEDVQRKEF